MAQSVSFSIQELQGSKTLNPNQSMDVPANINGTILIANDGQSSAVGSYLLTISGQTTSGSIPPNGSKLITYSSAQVGILQNTGTVALEVSIT